LFAGNRLHLAAEAADAVWNLLARSPVRNRRRAVNAEVSYAAFLSVAATPASLSA
jgi:hypothetical protein